MRVKKYHANTMPEAMAQIRADLGPDAVILHSEKVRPGGWLSFMHQQVLEVTAGVDPDLRDFPQPTTSAAEAIQQLQHELAAVKLALSQVPQAKRSSVLPTVNVGEKWSNSAGLDQWYRQLLAQGINNQLAQQILRGIANELNLWALEDQTILNKHLQWQLARRLKSTTFPFLAQLPVQTPELPAQPYIFSIVGPTGVGKTTTIAKLAATLVRTYPALSVLIITIDTFRVAAIPQIVTFGEILGVPVEVAYSPEHLAALVAANQQRHLILVDTPGRSQRSSTGLVELGDYLSVLPTKKVHLALATGTRYEDMKQAVDAFRPMSLNELIFTKVDESTSFGQAYTLACETGLPLSFLTTGQRVPEDIEVVTTERIANLVVGSENSDVVYGNE